MEKPADNPPYRTWTFYYDGDCGFCSWIVGRLARFDLLRQVNWTPYQSLEEPPTGLSWADLDRSAYLQTKAGRLYEGFYALRMLSARLVPMLPLAPVLWLPGVNLAGVAVYRWIARNRYRLSRCSVPLPRARQ